MQEFTFGIVSERRLATVWSEQIPDWRVGKAKRPRMNRLLIVLAASIFFITLVAPDVRRSPPSDQGPAICPRQDSPAERFAIVQPGAEFQLVEVSEVSRQDGASPTSMVHVIPGAFFALLAVDEVLFSSVLLGGWACEKTVIVTKSH